jgi:hypothetical protein
MTKKAAAAAAHSRVKVAREPRTTVARLAQ